ncbi:MAG: hypothetical protein ACKVQV_14160 [Bacteroidia bacterium]
MNWTPLDVLTPPKKIDDYQIKRKNRNSQVIGSLFENSPIVEVIDFEDYSRIEFMLEIEMPQMEKKVTWSDIHIRHKIRIYASLILLMSLTIDLFLGILGLPSLWSPFSDLLSIIGAFGLLGTSVYLTIDANGK